MVVDYRSYQARYQQAGSYDAGVPAYSVNEGAVPVGVRNADEKGVHLVKSANLSLD